MHIAIIGSGYVGLVSAAGFSDFGNNVICMDIDAKKIEQLKEGNIPIYEPGLSDLVKKNLKAGTLIFTTNIAEAVVNAEIIFIAVGTPPKEDGSADLSYVLKAAKSIGQSLTAWAVIVTKSTVPIGTTEKIFETIKQHTSLSFSVASNPEFLKEGDAISDFMKPDRVVIGVNDEMAKEALKQLYEPLIKTTDRLLIMDIRSAELTKYASNAMLATRISFMNDIANLCENIGANIDQVRAGVGFDSRIGPRFLYAGLGYGGSCFSKDVSALQSIAQENGISLDILKATSAINERQRKKFVKKIRQHFNEDIKGRSISIWGLSFKPNTDDVRDAPAIAIIDMLIELGARINVFDPASMDIIKNIYGDKIKYFDSHYAAVKKTDALLLITEWREFRNPDFLYLKTLMANNPVIFDGRNIWSPEVVKSFGFKYYGIGKK